MKLKGKKVCFLGDSITEGVGVSCTENRYTDVFKKITGVGEIKNYGISGTTIAKYITTNKNEKSEPNSFCERFDGMDDETDIVVVFGGTNDFGHGTAPFGEITDRDMYTYIGSLHYLMGNLINKYPMATIVFMTPLHRHDEYKPNESNNLTLKPYVDAMKEVANYYSIPILDLYAVSGIYPYIEKNMQAWCPDGLHPNDAGAERIAQRLASFLLNL